MNFFTTLDGSELDTQDPEWPLTEHVLQASRQVWVTLPQYPFLAIDRNRLDREKRRVRDGNGFVVFSPSALLLQNASAGELGQRMAQVLLGPGVNAGASEGSRHIVEGIANPLAHGLVRFNLPLMIGVHPYAALSTRYQFYSRKTTCQREFADLVVVNGFSRPRSKWVDFDRLADLVHEFHSDFINGPKDVPPDMERLSRLVDAIFVENTAVMAAAERHHAESLPTETQVAYPAVTLTRYGRLGHDADDNPKIEIAFALVHYERAIAELGEAKKAQSAHDREAEFAHGVYCVVAIAACIEAIANRLVAVATGAHPTYKDRRKPLDMLNESAAAIAAAHHLTFAPLVVGQPEFDALDEVRQLRNQFMHATEAEGDVDATSRVAVTMVEVSPDRCRMRLRQLRTAVASVFDQLPQLPSPIPTRTNVRWLGDLEVP